MTPVQEVKAPNRRLDSWKEIAAFFGRDERTVKRWEKERALPIHRLPGGLRARVFAFTEELDRWMHSLEVLPGDASPAEAIDPPEASLEILPESSELEIAQQLLRNQVARRSRGSLPPSSGYWSSRPSRRWRFDGIIWPCKLPPERRLQRIAPLPRRRSFICRDVITGTNERRRT